MITIEKDVLRVFALEVFKYLYNIDEFRAFKDLLKQTKSVHGEFFYSYPEKNGLSINRLFIDSSTINPHGDKLVRWHEQSFIVNGKKLLLSNQWCWKKSKSSSNPSLVALNNFVNKHYNLSARKEGDLFVLSNTQDGDPIPPVVPVGIKATDIANDCTAITTQPVVPVGIKATDIISTLFNATQTSNLIFNDTLITRFVTSLATKPFVILSGLSGSGKTQLATAFARWISVDYNKQVCVVPVGADWTNREFLLGYTNALEPQKYEATEVVRLMLRAQSDPSNPYFLILDEMNLSYVERYFADFLSTMETGEAISLWEKPQGSPDPTPNKIDQLPKNLFIIGTINVDETTYMFSPKVLDRANVIEFHIMRNDMKQFFKGFKPVDKSALDTNKDAKYGKKLVDIAIKTVEADEDIKADAVTTLEKFFDELKKVHAEFGYRTASEMFRFMTLYKQFDNIADFDSIVDAAIIQKLLPKLHGSRKKIAEVLIRMWALCLKTSDESKGLEKVQEFKAEDCKYPLSAEKIFRMYNIAIDNGYTSFAEA